MQREENQYLPQPQHILLLSWDVLVVSLWFYLHGKSKVVLCLGEEKKDAFEAKLLKTLCDYFRFCAISGGEKKVWWCQIKCLLLRLDFNVLI